VRDRNAALSRDRFQELATASARRDVARTRSTGCATTEPHAFDDARPGSTRASLHGVERELTKCVDGGEPADGLALTGLLLLTGLVPVGGPSSRSRCSDQCGSGQKTSRSYTSGFREISWRQETRR
jgi:hypothetical protein